MRVKRFANFQSFWLIDMKHFKSVSLKFWYRFGKFTVCSQAVQLLLCSYTTDEALQQTVQAPRSTYLGSIKHIIMFRGPMLLIAAKMSSQCINRWTCSLKVWTQIVRLQSRNIHRKILMSSSYGRWTMRKRREHVYSSAFQGQKVCYEKDNPFESDIEELKLRR